MGDVALRPGHVSDLPQPVRGIDLLGRLVGFGLAGNAEFQARSRIDAQVAVLGAQDRSGLILIIGLRGGL